MPPPLTVRLLFTAAAAQNEAGAPTRIVPGQTFRVTESSPARGGGARIVCEVVDASKTSWARTTHLFSILGFGTTLALALTLWLVVVSQVGLVSNPPQLTSSGPASINLWSVIALIFVPIVGATACSHASWAMMTGDAASAKKLLAKGAVAVLFGTAALAALVALDADIIYSCTAVVATCICSTWVVGSGWIRRRSPQPPTAVVTSTNTFQSRLEKTFQVLGMLLFTTYPLLILPRYFASGVSTRVVLCLVVHPLLLQLCEVGMRQMHTSLGEAGTGSLPLLDDLATTKSKTAHKHHAAFKFKIIMASLSERSSRKRARAHTLRYAFCERGCC